VFETAVHFIDTFRFLLGEVTEVFANLRRLNPVIRGEDTGQIFLRFDSGATALFDANRYNETESPRPRFTFGSSGSMGWGAI
jgi:D-apiose dehydrogenase